MTFGVSLVVLGLIVGLAIDMARVYNATRRIEAALDAAALAGAKILNETDEQNPAIQSAAYSAFIANVGGLAHADGALSNFSALPDLPNYSVNVGVTLAVPATFARLAGLTEFRVARNAASSYSMAKIEVALALDVTGSMNDTPAGDSMSKLAALKIAANDLIDTLFESASTDSNVRVSLVPWSSGVRAGSFATAVKGTSSGSDCIVERAGDGATSDILPDAISFAGEMPAASVAAGYVCPDLAVVPLSGRQQSSDLKAKINSLTGAGGTAGHLGTAWAWYMLSNAWSSLHPTSASRPEPPSSKVIKAAVIMTDGVFNTSHFGGVLDFGSGGYNDQSYTTFKTLCDGMTASGIRVFTIAFDLSDSHALDKMAECSGANAMTVSNAIQLQQAFRSIASELNAIRLTR